MLRPFEREPVAVVREFAHVRTENAESRIGDAINVPERIRYAGKCGIETHEQQVIIRRENEIGRENKVHAASYAPRAVGVVKRHRIGRAVVKLHEFMQRIVSDVRAGNEIRRVIIHLTDRDASRRRGVCAVTCARSQSVPERRAIGVTADGPIVLLAFETHRIHDAVLRVAGEIREEHLLAVFAQPEANVRWIMETGDFVEAHPTVRGNRRARRNGPLHQVGVGRTAVAQIPVRAKRDRRVRGVVEFDPIVRVQLVVEIRVRHNFVQENGRRRHGVRCAGRAAQKSAGAPIAGILA